jgi:tyrosyl-tRNA synthetase
VATQHKSNVLTELAWRGLIEQITHGELDEHLTSKATLYCGFDPTASSLHVGNLVPMMGLAFFHRHGHAPVAVVGGATGRIGDPSGKHEERTLLSDAVIEENLAGISAQLRAMLGRSLELHPETLGTDPAEATEVVFANNADWMGPWTFLDFLREVGKHFRVNTMIAKDSVRERLENREQGISYTEFSYMLIQAYDFLHLFQNQGCTVQIGGSDQWGNLTAGTDLIRKKLGEAAFGLTLPLLTTSSGAKFGKSEQGAVWLDPERTSPYEFYQYWVNTEDADCERFLKTFTFLAKDAIDACVAEIAAGENRGQVQQKLAHEVTSLIHGSEAADRAVRASKVLFGETITGFNDRELQSIFAQVPSTSLEMHRLDGDGLDVVSLFTEVGLTDSGGAARRLLKQGGAYVNNERLDAELRVTRANLASETLLVLRAGKKKVHLIRFT